MCKNRITLQNKAVSIRIMVTIFDFHFVLSEGEEQANL